LQIGITWQEQIYLVNLGHKSIFVDLMALYFWITGNWEGAGYAPLQ
jgi:hypothetical protein